MKNYLIDRNFAVLARAGSSFGNQPKFKKDDYWYKFDYLGNEGLAEQLTSGVLSCSSISDYVTYEYCQINGKSGCRSENMLAPGETLLPFSQLYFNATGGILADDVFSLNERERFNFIVDFIKEETDFDCSRYLFDNLTLDMLTRNPDRHFKNLALILTAEGEFKAAPIFDNGQGLMQNFTITPPDMEIEEKEDRCFACTISGSFEKQFMLAQDSTGYEPFKIDYDRLYALLQTYPQSIAKEYLEYSLERYEELFRSDREPQQEINSHPSFVTVLQDNEKVFQAYDYDDGFDPAEE